MRKIINIFICIVSILSFIVSFNSFDVDESNRVANIENEIGEAFYIPDDITLSNPEEVYLLLESISKELNVNIFRQSITSDENGNLETRKYLLISSQTNFWNHFKIDNSKLNLDVNEFLSTKNTNDKNQIEIIDEFGNNDIIYIGNLKNSYQISMVQGLYFVELPNELNFDVFITRLIEEINDKLNGDFSYEDFIPKSNGYIQLKSIDTEVLLYSVAILIITLILMCYAVLKNSKKINIYKLQGISNIRIWLNILQINNTIIFSIITIILILISFIFKLDINFIKYILKYQLIYYLLITIITLIPYILIVKTNINLSIKNKVNENMVTILNNIFKVILTYILISVSIIILSNYKILNKDLNTFEDWEKSKGYGVFYPKYEGNDLSKQDYVETNVTISNELYKILNNQGSIFIESSEYQDDVEIDSNIEVIKSIKVNPNYIKEFPVYDLLGNIINISEEETDRILLVPEAYKNDEEKILSYFDNNKKLKFDFEKIEFSGKIRKQVEIQNIKIIWTKDNQKIFSFNPMVNKNNKNIIDDPIIEVVTENNSVYSELFGILGGGTTDPLKVKLIENSPKITYEKLRPYLIQLNLEDNLKYLVASNEEELWNIYNIDEKMNLLYILLFIVIVCFIVVMVQNLIITFAKYKKKIVVRRLFGTSYIKSYKEHILIFFVNWIIQLMFTMKYIGTEFIFIIIVFIIAEAICSIIGIKIIEKKNKLNVIKGE